MNGTPAGFELGDGEDHAFPAGELLGLFGEASSKTGKLNERADVRRYPFLSPSAADADADVKDEDEHTNTITSKDAFVMDEIGNEEDTADEQGDVPPGPAVEEDEARTPTEHFESPPDRRSMNTTSPIFLFDPGAHAALPPSKKYDSRATGIAERAVQTVERQVRAMLLALESRPDAKISVTHNVITWLVAHAADILNKFSVGIDGRTAYERIKGKSTMMRWLSSGEESNVQDSV